jgi:hypothetical protein
MVYQTIIDFVANVRVIQSRSIRTGKYIQCSAPIFSLHSLFWKKYISRLMITMLSVYPSPPPPVNFWVPQPIFMKISVYIMAPEPIPMAYFINPSHRSMCLHVYLPIAAKQRLGKNVTAATNTHAIEELLNASFSMRSLSYQRKVNDYLFPELLVLNSSVVCFETIRWSVYFAVVSSLGVVPHKPCAELTWPLARYFHPHVPKIKQNCIDGSHFFVLLWHQLRQ